jgi:hypothetical protein
VERCGITERGSPAETWLEGAKLLFGLAFRSGYTWMFQAAGIREAPRASAGCSEEPQIRERGEVCAVLFLC